jgi:hypothetical protein
LQSAKECQQPNNIATLQSMGGGLAARRALGRQKPSRFAETVCSWGEGGSPSP